MAVDNASDGLAPEPACRVLVVEDEIADADLICERLSDVPGHRFEVDRTDTLASGLDLLGRRPFDVVVVDINLPDSTGLDTLTRVRRLVPHLPVLVLTGMADPALREQALRNGATDVLHKNEPASRLLARAVLYSLERTRADAHRRRIELLIAASPDGIIVTDLSGQIVFVNQAAQALFGRTEDQFIGEYMSFSIQDGQAFEIDLLTGANRRTAELRVAECQWHDAKGVMATIRDVTERNRMAEQLRHKQKLEAIGQLAGGVAHDFNNLLTVIMSRAEVALASTRAGSESHAHLLSIQTASHRAASLTRQLLTFARRQATVPAVVSLNDVVTSFQQLIGRLIGEHIQVELRLSEEMPSVLVDPDQMGQVLTNLAVNARDAMPTGGRLLLQTDNIVLSAAQAKDLGLLPGRHARLLVSDTGPGVPLDVRDRVFEPFFTTKKELGTGLGLSIVHGIVTQSGGHVRLAGREGAGATFEILLPEAEPNSEPAPPPPSSVSALIGTERILLVEDEHEVREVTSAMLGDYGYTVVPVADGRAALAAWAESAEPFALVLTDIVMPGMSGWELGQMLGRIAPQQRVLYMSGYSEEVLASQGVPGASVALLQKPFTSLDLARAVRRALDLPTMH